MDEQKHGRMIDADRLIEFCEKVASVSNKESAKMWEFIAAFIECQLVIWQDRS